jgi:hypothetical protein
MSRAALVLAALAVTLSAGCASGLAPIAGDATSTVQERDCRGGGYYNRAAGFCVSGGP